MSWVSFVALKQPPKQPLLFKIKKKKKCNRPGEKRLLCAYESTIYLSFVICTLSALGTDPSKMAAGIVEGKHPPAPQQLFNKKHSLCLLTPNQINSPTGS